MVARDPLSLAGDVEVVRVDQADPLSAITELYLVDHNDQERLTGNLLGTGEAASLGYGSMGHADPPTPYVLTVPDGGTSQIDTYSVVPTAVEKRCVRNAALGTITIDVGAGNSAVVQVSLSASVTSDSNNHEVRMRLLDNLVATELFIELDTHTTQRRNGAMTADLLLADGDVLAAAIENIDTGAVDITFHSQSLAIEILDIIPTP